jgi:hypothetical protein
MNTLGNYLDDELDTSWIDDLDKLNNIHHSYFREPMKNIDFFILFVDSNDSILKIKKENHKFSTIDKNCTFTNSFIIQFIERIKNTYSKGNTRYKLNDVLLYNIDLEPTDIQSYSNNENLEDMSKPFFKVLPIINDIYFTDSIFIFHGINSLFFLFQEMETTDSSRKHTLKSILKINKGKEKKHNTKKVNIRVGEDSIYKHKKTYKNHNNESI